MNLFTPVKIPAYKSKIDYTKSIIFIGSCFTENIGNKFKDLFFKTLINPFGIIYNPSSVKEGFDLLLSKRVFTEEDLFYFNEQWHSFAHHGVFSGTDKTVVLKMMNDNLLHAYDFLKNADFLFITFGTSWVYELVKSGSIVSNCHKLPSEEFNRRLLTVDKIVETYILILNHIKIFNPKINIILTISPVRHLKDGAIGNQVSKSTLILAVNQLVNMFDFVDYFPAYEIVLDELRDYRFYAGDMTHLNSSSVDYIWEKIEAAFFSNKMLDELKLSKNLLKNINHRIVNKQSKEASSFKNKIKKQIDELKQKHDLIDLSAAEKYLNT
ncbi:MAG: GSCFA domain-containing protein [Bacteroidales bacterium]|nr:GSCFA domain-containing protein [Bacteroidales bacterium]